MFEHITKLVRTSLRVPLAAVSLIDTDRQWFKSIEGPDGCDGPRETSFCAVTIEQRRPMIVEDAREHHRFAANPLVTDAPFIRSYAGAPLTLSDGYQAGALCAIDTVPRPFSSGEIDVLAQLATCVVTEIELRQRASRDGMTGFMLRHPFLTRLRVMHDRHVARQTPAALAILDLDHFKSVNDRYGHDAGDAVIRSVADCCRRVLTGDVQLGRLGGEEFAIAFPGRSVDEAFDELGQLRTALERLSVPDYPGLSVTASFGLAGLNPGIANVSVWCKMADAALYGAKQAGRNRVTVCDNPRGIGTQASTVAFPFFAGVAESSDIDRVGDRMMARGNA